MDYRTFDVQDFAMDESFIHWVMQADSESCLFWENWISLNPDRLETVEAARHLVENINFTETWNAAEKSSMWNQIQAAIQDGVSGKQKTERMWWYRFPYAAAFATLVMVAGGLYLLQRPIEIRTAYGKQKSFTMTDGTKVMLNANSSITFNRDFSDQPIREVWVTGEAFFEVKTVLKKGGKVPFTVHANQLDVQVLGTAFGITNRRGRVDVALEHGSVKLVEPGNASNSILLSPGEKATQLTKTAPLVKEAVNTAEYTSWKRKVVHYNGKSLQELGEMIYDAYGIEVIIESEDLKRERFTGSFPTDSVHVFFEKLGKLYPLDISKRGEKYYLR